MKICSRCHLCTITRMVIVQVINSVFEFFHCICLLLFINKSLNFLLLFNNILRNVAFLITNWYYFHTYNYISLFVSYEHRKLYWQLQLRFLVKLESVKSNHRASGVDVLSYLCLFNFGYSLVIERILLLYSSNFYFVKNFGGSY